jgi:hypothetical protein
MATEYSDLMLYHAEKIVALLTANAAHNPALHLTPAAATDAGLNAFCPGCELTTRIKRLYLLDINKDQTAVRRRIGKSPRDEAFERVRTALSREEPEVNPVRPAGQR